MATIKQKKAFKEMADNGGNVSAAMRKVGYSSVMAKNPQKLTRSRGWKELMDQYLPDELLAQKHLALLNKTETRRAFDHNSGEYVSLKTDDLDASAVARGLDLAYKIKGKYGDPIQAQFNLSFTGISLERPPKKIEEGEILSTTEVERFSDHAQR